MNAVCLVLDRLHCGFLGCYGNSWVPTPAFNRLATEGFAVDQAYDDSPSLDTIYTSLWLGRHALAHEGAAEGTASLPQLLRNAGVATYLVTDEPRVAEHRLAAAFGHSNGAFFEKSRRLAEKPEDTLLAHFFAEAFEVVHSLKPPFLCWLHSGGLAAAWDAPYELRSQFADEDDPPPPRSVEVPNLRLPKDADPDLLLGIRQAYAGQVALLDSCLDVLLDELAAAAWAKDTLLVVLSARGMCLGQHRVVGQPRDEAEPLYSELTAIPWLLRFPDGTGAADRSQALVQPPDLTVTLSEWFGLAAASGVARGRSLLPGIRGEADAVRDRACVVSGSQRAIRTLGWYARFPSAETADLAASAELFVKPDDRWELNDVASRCPEVAQAMQQAADDYERACRAELRGEPAELGELPEVLLAPLV
jgi:arylsulfatase A-like enzyme